MHRASEKQEFAMPRTSTAERFHHLCPLCGKPLDRDTDHKGWVRHKERPDVEGLLADSAKRQLMSEEDIHYLQTLGLCPYERGQKDNVAPPQLRYEHLGPWQGSHYRQYFLKDRKVRAETLYRRLFGSEPMTPAQVAEDYDVPIEAVFEAIDYCEHNDDLLRHERETDRAIAERIELDRSSALPAKP
jgi:hypothetical protein